MTIDICKVKSILKSNGVFYAVGLAAAFAMKLWYSRAGIGDLDWILAPTTWWVQLLSGIDFKKVPGVGYINHNYEFVIAPVCAGINFMIIALSTLVFSFMHRMGNVKSKITWMIMSIVAIYPYTIIVNSLRIIPSIYLLQMDFYSGWLTPERVHTMEGTLVYFAALLFLYHIADKASIRLSPEHASGAVRTTEPSKPVLYSILKWSLPVFFYFAITLGIPFLNGAYGNDSAKFIEYAAMVTGVCSCVIGLICILILLSKYLRGKHNMRKAAGSRN